MKTGAKQQAQLDDENFADELSPGTILLHGQYTIEHYINSGGFGITYLARDSLDRQVVIKECFPGSICRRSNTTVRARSLTQQNDFTTVVRLFIQEAQNLSKLKHPNIVGVHQVFEDNETAYMALDFIDGHDMLDLLENSDRILTPSQIKEILGQLLTAVDFMHGKNVLHRDISPDNILLDHAYKPVLIDFGAAREEAAKGSRVLSAIHVVKDGYSPQEFYFAGGDHSPSSDLYALAASFYHLIVGEAPPNSHMRLSAIAGHDPDPYVPISGRVTGYSDAFLAAIDKALNVFPKDRIQSAREWLDQIDEDKQIDLSRAAVGKDDQAVDQKVPDLAATASPDLTSPVPTDTSVETAQPLKANSRGVDASPLEGVFRTGGPGVAPTRTPYRGLLLGSVAAIGSAAVVAFTMFDFGTPEPSVDAQVVEAPLVAPSAPPALPASPEASVDEASMPPSEKDELAPRLAANDLPDVEAVPQELEKEPDPAQSETDSLAEVAGETKPTVVTDVTAPVVQAETTEVSEIVVPAEQSEEPRLIANPAKPQLENAPSDTEFAALAEASRPELISPAEPVITAEPVVDATEPVADATSQPLDTKSELELAPVMSGRFIELPFTTKSGSDTIIASLKDGSAPWMTPGQRITDVNGVEVRTVADIRNALRSTTDPSQATNVKVLFGVRNASDGEIVGQTAVLPVVNEVALLDGTRFQTRFSNGQWETKVAAVSQQADAEFRVGDSVVAFLATGEEIDGETDIGDILKREVNAGTTVFNFAVRRGGDIWVVSFGYNSVEAD